MNIHGPSTKIFDNLRSQITFKCSHLTWILFFCKQGLHIKGLPMNTWPQENRKERTEFN